MLKQFRETFRALKSRNYRLFFAGQSVSLIGSWLTRVAMSWLVFRLTRSALWLGVVSFANQIPTGLLVPLAGIAVDRHDRHRILIITQTFLTVHAFILAALALSRTIQVWHILFLSIFQGMIHAFDIPARQSLVVEMVDKREDLGNAIALNSSMFNGARLIGPAVAGILIATVGEGICFLLDGISYLAVITSLFAMKLKPFALSDSREDWWGSFKEGFTHTFGSAPSRAILFLVGSVSLMGMSYIVLLPMFAQNVLGGGPRIFGFLTAASGLGALAGALYLASRKSVVGLTRIILLASLLSAGGLIGFAASSDLRASLLFILIVSFGMIVQMAASNTVLQMLVDDDKRGRALSFFTFCFLGMSPIGSLWAGTLAHHFGPQAAVLIGGAACLLIAFHFWRKLPTLRAGIRPIYVQKGILPEIASGLQSTANLSDIEN